MPITPAADVVAAAHSRIMALGTQTVMALVDDPDVVIIDLRDVRERRNGSIPGGFHAPHGMIVPGRFRKPVSQADLCARQATRLSLCIRLEVGADRGGLAGHRV